MPNESSSKQKQQAWIPKIVAPPHTAPLARLSIDINRDDYNYETAHKDKTVLPVYVLRKHRGNWVLLRWPREDERLAAELAELHRVTGYGAATPFLENHNSRVIYANPREFLK
ncbi:hypothetical protein BJX99DRAFT_217385 [Aspergillus californicus]